MKRLFGHNYPTFALKSVRLASRMDPSICTHLMTVHELPQHSFNTGSRKLLIRKPNMDAFLKQFHPPTILITWTSKWMFYKMFPQQILHAFLSPHPNNMISLLQPPPHYSLRSTTNCTLTSSHFGKNIFLSTVSKRIGHFLPSN